MCKTFFKVALLGALISNLSLADDFLAKVSNGALSDHSQGVKVLTQDEMSRVVGGYKLYNNGVVYTLQNIKSSVSSLAQIGVLVEFTKFELDNSVNCGFGVTKNCESNKRLITAKNAFSEVFSQANQNRGEYLALTTTKTAIATGFGVQYKFGTAAAVVGISGGKPYRIRAGKASGKIFNEVKSAYENQLNKILITKY